MSKYIKLFDTHDDYLGYINGNNKILPNVSYCKDNNDVHFSTPKYVTIKYNTSGNTTKLINTLNDISVNIDGVTTTISSGEYLFETTGIHTVKYLITNITLSLFEDCTEIVEVTLPNTIYSIGEAAFKGCTNLHTVLLKKCTEIGDEAFYNCTELQVIDLSNIVTLGVESFYNCSKLLEVDISNVTGILPDGVFLNCGLTNISIPGTVTEIGVGSFKLSNITNIKLPNSITIIDNEAFLNCIKLLNIDIPASVTRIGDRAFASCGILRSVNINIDSNLQSIGNNVFYLCGSLEIFNINKPIPPTIGENVFSFTQCNIIVPISYENDYLIEWSNYISNINIPIVAGINIESTENVYKIAHVYDLFDKILIDNTEIIPTDYYLFNSTGIHTIKYKTSSKLLLSNTFKDCEFSTINIPSGILTLGDSVFNGCSNLTAGKIPNTISSIGTLLFKNCVNLTKVIPLNYSSDSIQSQTLEIPNKITSIPNGMFENCSNITTLEIPEFVTTIGDNAFNSINVNSLIIPINVKFISQSAFSNATIKTIKFNSNIVSLNYTLLSNLVSIFGTNNNRIYLFGDNITSIGNYAFACNELSTIKLIHLSKNISLIGDHAFYNNLSLYLYIYIDDSNPEPISINNISYPSSIDSPQELGIIDLHIGTITRIQGGIYVGIQLIFDDSILLDFNYLDLIYEKYTNTWGRLKRLDGNNYNI